MGYKAGGREEVESGELGVGWCCGEGERGAKLRCMMSDGLGREDERAVEVLRGLGGEPATPFFEERVARLVLGYLREMGVEHWRDEYGNIVARYRRGDVAGRPAVAFVAHMDHPGFEVVEVEVDGLRAAAVAQGGVPAASLTKATGVLVVTPEGERVPATTVPEGDGLAQRRVGLELASPIRAEPPLPAVFDLPDFELEDGVITMRALDDLAGCASIIAALERVVRSQESANVYAVFTRAEEAGLYGARLVAEAGALPEDTLVVSVESSSVIPGVAQGAGPIIRTGDRASTFDDDAEQVLAAAAEVLGNGFAVQRQLMTGGTCEATAFGSFGYRVTGLAYPLGNYHNATTSIPEPDGGVGAEYIRLSDYLGGVALLQQATLGFGASETRAWLREVPQEARDRLRRCSG